MRRVGVGERVLVPGRGEGRVWAGTVLKGRGIPESVEVAGALGAGDADACCTCDGHVCSVVV
jgi:hypothetical protein